MHIAIDSILITTHPTILLTYSIQCNCTRTKMCKQITIINSGPINPISSQNKYFSIRGPKIPQILPCVIQFSIPHILIHSLTYVFPHILTHILLHTLPNSLSHYLLKTYLTIRIILHLTIHYNSSIL